MWEHSEAGIADLSTRMYVLDYANLPTPIGLTWEERGGSGEPITVATEPISVLAWVRCLKISTHVNGPALPFNVDALRCLR